MFIPKKNRKLQLIINYYKFNEIIVKDYILLLLIIEIRDRLYSINWFIALDLKGAYNLIYIKEGNK